MITRGRLLFVGLLLAVVTAIAWVPVRCHLAIRQLESGDPAAQMKAITYLREHRSRDTALFALCRAAVSDERARVRSRALEAAAAGAGRRGYCFLTLLQSAADDAARIRAAQLLDEDQRHVRGGYEAILRVGGLDESAEVRRGVSEVARAWSQRVNSTARLSRHADLRLAAIRILTYDRTTDQLTDVLLAGESQEHAHEIAVRALLDREGPVRLLGLWRSLRSSKVPLKVRADVVRTLARLSPSKSERFLAEFDAAPPETHRAIGEAVAAADEDLGRTLGAALLERASDPASLQDLAAALDGLGAKSGEPALGTFDLAEALDRKLLVVRARGSDITNVRVDVARISRAGFQVHIPPGTIFVSSTKAQNMIVTRGVTLSFIERWKHEASLKAACAQIWKRIPRGKDAFEERIEPPSGDLGRIAPLLDEVAFTVQQAAVWIVASDVTRKDLDQLREIYQSPPLVPSPSSRPRIQNKHVVAAIRLMERAGLDVTRYRIHAWYERNK